MIMKNAESALNFYQIDNKIDRIQGKEEVVILPSNLAWKNFIWTHEYFDRKPKQGFFLWVKKNTKQKLNTLIEITSKNIIQEMTNLIIIEKGINAELASFCRSVKRVKGKHFALAKIIIKENSNLEFSQGNLWRKEDEFEANYSFILAKGAKLKTVITNQGDGAKINTKENIYLKGKGSSADVRIKMIAKEKGTFFSESYMHGEDEVKGHLECSGLIIDKKSKITSIPGIICNSNKAELTHEASIGKISEEKLMYLRMRGLSEKKATELIIKSFLNS
ncbi:MAG TPA: SufD family Fe-S cluster assembly protein [Candidatus Pacearchaeota archaeon]|nr:SufD family Fe-S cluster assembly protein [Candidatus Pacearchaeota archaeon]